MTIIPPTRSARTLTLNCPAWCVEDIPSDDDAVLHTSHVVSVLATGGTPSMYTVVRAELERMDERGETGQVVLRVGETMFTLTEGLEFAAGLNGLVHDALWDWATTPGDDEVEPVQSPGHSERAAMAAALADVDPVPAVQLSRRTKRLNRRSI